MIENKNYLFIHVPRTAGSSLGYVLHTALNGDRIYDIHSSFSELENTCPKRVKNKFKFGFVRNPFEREFSQWLYHAYKPEFLVTPTFEEWITWRYSDYKMPKSFIAKGHDAYNYLKQFSVLPQIGFFLDKENNYKIDFLGPTYSLFDCIVFGFISGVFGQLGDFGESLLKRDVGVKDSGDILRGHGGILDRFDSLLFSSPLIYIYLLVFNQ
mgnify:CR=1 FL=1